MGDEKSGGLRQGSSGWVRAWFAHERWPWACALVAVLLAAPSLTAGLAADDYAHRVWILAPERTPLGEKPPWDMYRFVSGNARERQLALDAGVQPWWMHPELRLGFFRPISSMSIWFDHRLLSKWPALMHVQSVLVYGLAALFAARALRGVFALLGRPAWVAGFAGLLWALDDAHGMTVGWIANRHGVLAGMFCFASLDALAAAVLDEGERGPSAATRRGRRGALGLFVLAMLSSESSLALLPFAALVAYAGAERTLVRSGPRETLRTVASYAALLAVWAVPYTLAGYGTRNSGLYVDPLGEPLAFARAVVERLPWLLLGLFAIPPAEAGGQVAPAAMLSVALGLWAVVAVLAVLGARVLRGVPRAGLLCGATVLALLPACATIPNDRLLVIPGVGGVALVAMGFERLGDKTATFGAFARRALRGGIILVHVVLAALLLPLRTHTMAALFGDMSRRGEQSAPRDEALRGQTLVLVNAPDVLVPVYAASQRAGTNEPLPARMRLLTTTVRGRGQLTRTDDRTIEIALDAGFLHDPFSTVLRSVRATMPAGSVVDMAGMRVTVLETTRDGRPARVRFAFDRPLDDQSLRWFTWRTTRFEPFELPPAGHAVVFEAIDYARALSGR